MNVTYSTLLTQILQEQDINLANLHNELCDLGMKITYASLYSYFNGAVIPPYSVAKEILRLEKINIDSEELEAILDYSKKVAKQERSDDGKILNLNLKIKPEYIDLSYKKNAQGLKNIIEMRAEELFGNEELMSTFQAGGKRKLSAYVAYLIKKDLEDSDFIKEE